MIAVYKLGTRLGWALVLLSACGGDEGSAPADAATPKDAGRDAESPTTDSGQIDPWRADASNDAGRSDAGQYDAGELDGGCNCDGGPSPPQATINLTTGAGTPACVAAGPAASGTASVTVWGTTSSKTVAVYLTWQNLSSPVTAAHIHYGAAGASGPVVLPFATSMQSANFTAMDYLAAPGAPISFDAFMTDFMAGKSYLNLHTQNCPDGEIRGQIVFP